MENKKRIFLRDPIEADILCRPLITGSTGQITQGLMRNYSCQGAYIESNRKYRPGTILIIRIVNFPVMPAQKKKETEPRSFGLAEVKWHSELIEEKDTRYGIGLRYLS